MRHATSIGLTLVTIAFKKDSGLHLQYNAIICIHKNNCFFLINLLFDIWQHAANKRYPYIKRQHEIHMYKETKAKSIFHHAKLADQFTPEPVNLNMDNKPETITAMSWRARWLLKSSTFRLFAQPFVQAQIKVKIKAPRHWPLRGEPVTSGLRRPVSRKNASNWWRHHPNN